MQITCKTALKENQGVTLYSTKWKIYDDLLIIDATVGGTLTFLFTTNLFLCVVDNARLM